MFACALDSAPHIHHRGVAVERWSDYQHRARRGRSENIFIVHRQPALLPNEEPKTRNQTVQVRVLPDPFQALACRCPQRSETGNRHYSFHPRLKRGGPQRDLSAECIAGQINAGGVDLLQFRRRIHGRARIGYHLAQQ